MAYKAIAKRIPRTKDTFRITSALEKMQKNGVTNLVARAVHDDGMRKRDVTIFANGGRVDLLRSHLIPGREVCLQGKYSQSNTFVALGVA